MVKKTKKKVIDSNEKLEIVDEVCEMFLSNTFVVIEILRKLARESK